MSPPALSVHHVATVAWTPELPGESRPAGPGPGAGALVVDGFTPPVRPHLELSCSGTVAVGWFVGPGADGRTLVRLPSAGPETVTLAEEARGAVGRAEGAWVLTAGAVSALDRVGRVAAEVALMADGLLGVGSTDDLVWALEPGAAHLVTAAGSSTRLDAPWSSPLGVVASGDSLVGGDPERPGRLLVLDPDGSRRDLDAGVRPEPHERLLAWDGSAALFAALSGLRRAGGVDDALQLVGCGATDHGVFVAVRTADGAWLHTSESGPRPLRLADGERVLAVAETRVLVASRTHARWLPVGTDEAEPDEPLSLDEASYRAEVEPHAWHLPSGYGVHARSPGELLLTASGPTGAVVLAVDWPVAHGGRG